MQKIIWNLGLSILATTFVMACGNGEDPGDNIDDHDATDIERVVTLGAQCDDGQGTRTMRVLLTADGDKPVKLGEAEEAQGSWSLRTLVEADIRLEDSRAYSFPDISCEDDGDCPGELTCSVGLDGADDLGPRCNGPASVTADGAPRFSGDEPPSQAMAVAISNTGQWRGLLPAQIGELYPVNEHGDVIGEPDQSVDADRASDSFEVRFAALRQLGQQWQEMASTVADDQRDAHIGLWSFEDSASTVFSRVAETQGESTEMWTDDNMVFRQAIDTLSGDRPGPTRAHVYSSLITLMDLAFVDTPEGAAANHRSLLVIVSGPDEFRRSDTTVQNVINKARNLGVEVSVLQVDAPLDNQLLRDDYRYYDDQSECSSDDECANFEECRRAELYSWGAGGGIDYPSDPEATYCLLNRDENGRLGPIMDYQQLACETGGSFLYAAVDDGDLMYSRMEGIPWAPEAAWDVDFAVEEPALEPHRSYSLQSELHIGSATYDLSQNGLDELGGTPESSDSRAIVFGPKP